MGAGKSTIGRLLAKELKFPFKDSDREIEVRTGADIPWIFDVEGEEGKALSLNETLRNKFVALLEDRFSSSEDSEEIPF